MAQPIHARKGNSLGELQQKIATPKSGDFINEQIEISSAEQIGSAPPGGMPPCFFKKIFVHKSYVAPSLSRFIHKYDPT